MKIRAYKDAQWRFRATRRLPTLRRGLAAVGNPPAALAKLAQIERGLLAQWPGAEALVLRTLVEDLFRGLKRADRLRNDIEVGRLMAYMHAKLAGKL